MAPGPIPSPKSGSSSSGVGAIGQMPCAMPSSLGSDAVPSP